jgi:hypothetical protein
VSAANPVPDYQPGYVARAIRRVSGGRRRSRVVRVETVNDGLCWRSLCWCFPWDTPLYPGRVRGFLALLPRSYTRQAVWLWCREKRRMPSASARAVADYIEGRCAEGLAIVASLREEADRMDAEPKRLVGVCAVDPESGRDKRGNWRR